MVEAPVNRLSCSKAPKTQQICHYRHTRITSELFLSFNTGVDFSLRNNFANSGFIAKVSIPVHIYNSLYRFCLKSELFTHYGCIFKYKACKCNVSLLSSFISVKISDNTSTLTLTLYWLERTLC